MTPLLFLFVTLIGVSVVFDLIQAATLLIGNVSDEDNTIASMVVIKMYLRALTIGLLYLILSY